VAIPEASPPLTNVFGPGHDFVDELGRRVEETRQADLDVRGGGDDERIAIYGAADHVGSPSSSCSSLAGKRRGGPVALPTLRDSAPSTARHPSGDRVRCGRAGTGHHAGAR